MMAMDNYFAFFLALLLLSCSSINQKIGHENNLSVYSNNYYVIIYFTPLNSHPLSMGGIGSRIDIDSLDTIDIQKFIESFYDQLAYTPHITDIKYSYPKTINCLGYDIKWNGKYSLDDIFSKVIAEKDIKLDDSIYINMKMYYMRKDLKVVYIENFYDCISHSSIELDINLIKSIDKVAILVDEVN